MKMVLAVVRPKMGVDSLFHEVESMLDEGSSMDSPLIDLGLLKTFRIACWTKIFHVTFLELDSMILLKMNGLKCVWKMIC